ncbi:helix-turn-helix transcriptional regulator [Bordetella petrii]|uniref:helix-turn-helix transcriptional regulator n=1 Tax=Bordetella petrii TaxID=94624 RepID=UPI001A97A744|nr:AlpA family phage regulatory protein [Bordetella petrii]MBO1111826.1 AlpA family phage regulatory protein [Bordetella petrii]
MADHVKAMLIKRQEVEALTQLGRSSLYAKLNPKDANHDPSFPVPVRVGATAVRWVASEVDAWILSRPRTRLFSANDGVIFPDQREVSHG